MKVLVLGGGTVGSSVARFLCHKGHEVTVVDQKYEVCAQLGESTDVRTIVGPASVASTLFRAEVGSHDLCLALTNNHEVNLVASCLAKTMGAGRTVARVYADILLDLHRLDYRKAFGVDRFLGIEYLTALEIVRRIRDPGSMMIEHFAQGHTEMQEILISRASGSTGVPLKELRLPGTVRIGSINRDGWITIATATDTINPGDRVTILGEVQAIDEVKKRFEIAPLRRRNVLIAGGGEVAFHLADILETRKNKVVLLDKSQDRCAELSRRLRTTIVIHGDARRRSTLTEERVAETDCFVAATNDDETNIMCCLEAKALGSKSVIAIINNADYGEVVEKLGIDMTISPYDVVCRQVEGLLHTGALTFSNPYMLGNGIDVVELTAQENSPITEAPLKECGIPRQALLASVVRGATPQLPNAEFRIQPGDTAIALVHKTEEERLVELFTNRKNRSRPVKESFTETFIKSLGK
ncbi:MAG: Trk system potassium transporter TrkA [Thermoguttaceae bacterium]|jgi:trk system potassium uptake protein TrkA